ncbi:MAG TPA: hypothetical protein VNB06_12970 [Thermoanaerobaculia bacterium]|nr:hypothetical protein [Thermoanaerobaculia bacterium]
MNAERPDPISPHRLWKLAAPLALLAARAAAAGTGELLWQVDTHG